MCELCFCGCSLCVCVTRFQRVSVAATSPCVGTNAIYPFARELAFSNIDTPALATTTNVGAAIPGFPTANNARTFALWVSDCSTLRVFFLHACNLVSQFRSSNLIQLPTHCKSDYLAICASRHLCVRMHLYRPLLTVDDNTHTCSAGKEFAFLAVGSTLKLSVASVRLLLLFDCASSVICRPVHFRSQVGVACFVCLIMMVL